jgi:hypothetical protein
MPLTDWNIMIMLPSDVSTAYIFGLQPLTIEKTLLPNYDFTLTNSDGQRLLPFKLETLCTELTEN